MAKREKAPSTIIKEQAAEIEKLTKERDDFKQQKDSYWSRYQEASKQIDEVHAMLDAFPSVPRSTEGKDRPYRPSCELTIMARLAIMLATANKAPAAEKEAN